MTKSEAVAHYEGSISKLAKALDVSYEAVRQWDEIPELRQYQLEVITDGALKADRRIELSAPQQLAS